MDAELLKIQLRLIEQRDAWYRRCRVAWIVAAWLFTAWIAREVFLAGGYL